MREEEIRQYIHSKISHAGFKSIDLALLNQIELELFKWHDSDKNKFMDLMQLYYEGTLQGFEITMKNFCKNEIEAFLHNSAGTSLLLSSLSSSLLLLSIARSANNGKRSC